MQDSRRQQRRDRGQKGATEGAAAVNAQQVADGVLVVDSALAVGDQLVNSLLWRFE
jgi:hypothetical protein